MHKFIFSSNTESRFHAWQANVSETEIPTQEMIMLVTPTHSAAKQGLYIYYVY